MFLLLHRLQFAAVTHNKDKQHQKNANSTPETIVSVWMKIAITPWIIMLLSSIAKHLCECIRLSFNSAGIIPFPNECVLFFLLLTVIFHNTLAEPGLLFQEFFFLLIWKIKKEKSALNYIIIS